jgi:hypothetical protein
MTKQISGYEYPANGYYNETVVVFTDGSKANVCVQYSSVMPLGSHTDDCEQVTKMGGRCTCGKLDGIDVPALLADAKANGKFGEAPKAPKPVSVIMTIHETHGFGWCDKCHSYCYGDCEAT